MARKYSPYFSLVENSPSLGEKEGGTRLGNEPPGKKIDDAEEVKQAYAGTRAARTIAVAASSAEEEEEAEKEEEEKEEEAAEVLALPAKDEDGEDGN